LDYIAIVGQLTTRLKTSTEPGNGIILRSVPTMRRSVPVSVRLSQETYRLARELARRTSRPLSAVVSELAEEALRIRRHPGIVPARRTSNARDRSWSI